MKLERLREKHSQIFTTSEANTLGVSPQLLRHYLAKGLIERASHGVYRFPSNYGLDLESQIKELLKAAPQAIISHKTALRLYGLTEETPAQIDLLVPDKNIPKRKFEDVKLHPLAAGLMRNGLTSLRGIRITSLERTLIDLLRAGEPLSLVMAAFRDAQNKKMKPSLTRIRKLGSQLHAKAKTALFLEALL